MFFANRILFLALILATSNAFAFGVKKKPEAPQAKTETSTSVAPASDQIWVKKPDGGLACDSDKKGVTPLDVGKAELKKAGVEVFDAKKGNDGMMRAAVCGIATGNENHFLISKKDSDRAIRLGYQLVK